MLTDIRSLAHQLLRFAGVGALIMLLYLTVTTVLSQVLGAPFQVAVVVGYFTGVTVHFMLQRIFVFASAADYALGLRGQLIRFVVLVVVQYSVTATSVAMLPHALGLPRFVVWLGTVALVTPVSFLVLRTKLFHPVVAVAGQPMSNPHAAIGSGHAESA